MAYYSSTRLWFGELVATLYIDDQDACFFNLIRIKNIYISFDFFFYIKMINILVKVICNFNEKSCHGMVSKSSFN